MGGTLGLGGQGGQGDDPAGGRADDAGTSRVVRQDVVHRPKFGGPRKHPLPRIGDRFGELTVTGFVVGQDGYPHAQDKAVLVKCSCGSPEYATKSNWLDTGKHGGCRACSRVRASACMAERTGYGRFFGDKDAERAYIARLSASVRRCYDPNDERYPDYGGRGIRNWWFEQFGKDAKRRSRFESTVWKVRMLEYLSTLDGWGDRSLQIDRIDVNGDYAPGNIRLVSLAENTRTRRRIRYVHAAALDVAQENQQLRQRVAELEAEIASLRSSQLRPA